MGLKLVGDTKDIYGQNHLDIKISMDRTIWMFIQEIRFHQFSSDLMPNNLFQLINGAPVE